MIFFESFFFLSQSKQIFNLCIFIRVEKSLTFQFGT